jgi:integrase
MSRPVFHRVPPSVNLDMEGSATLGHMPDYYPIMLCAFRYGIREGELIALKAMDVDFNGRFIEVRRTFYRGRITPPKGNEPRRVDMSIQLTNALDELIGKRKADALTRELQKPLAERRKPEEVINAVIEGWLFTTPVNTRLDPSNLRKIFHALLTKAELRRIRFQDARHTYATLLIEQGESLAYVKDQLGHSSIQITVDTYGHLVPGAIGRQ